MQKVPRHICKTTDRQKSGDDSSISKAKSKEVETVTRTTTEFERRAAVSELRGTAPRLELIPVRSRHAKTTYSKLHSVDLSAPILSRTLTKYGQIRYLCCRLQKVDSARSSHPRSLGYSETIGRDTRPWTTTSPIFQLNYFVWVHPSESMGRQWVGVRGLSVGDAESRPRLQILVGEWEGREGGAYDLHDLFRPFEEHSPPASWVRERIIFRALP